MGMFDRKKNTAIEPTFPFEKDTLVAGHITAAFIYRLASSDYTFNDPTDSR